MLSRIVRIRWIRVSGRNDETRRRGLDTGSRIAKLIFSRWNGETQRRGIQAVSRIASRTLSRWTEI